MRRLYASIATFVLIAGAAYYDIFRPNEKLRPAHVYFAASCVAVCLAQKEEQDDRRAIRRLR